MAPSIRGPRTTKPFYLYRAYSEQGRLLYIGITTCVERRAQEHRSGHNWWRTDVARIESTLIGPRVVAQAAEAVAIRTENPVHNMRRAETNLSRCWRQLARYLDEERLTPADLAASCGVEIDLVEKWLSPPRDGVQQSSAIPEDPLNLQALADEWAAARAAVENVKRRMKDAAVKASKLGVPETAIARHFGVNRLTVREWLGKK